MWALSPTSAQVVIQRPASSITHGLGLLDSPVFLVELLSDQSLKPLDGGFKGGHSSSILVQQPIPFLTAHTSAKASLPPTFEEFAQNGVRREIVPEVFGGARRTLCAS
jgi:hypothetical protein